MALQLEDEEAEAVRARSKAPRVTLADMEARITDKIFTTADKLTDKATITTDPLRLLTLCVLVLDNGFTLVGKSAPASPENFDAEYGRKLAYEDCIRQLWPLEGYLLRTKLSEA